MCKCKEMKNAAAVAKKVAKAGTNVDVTINVTNIVKYVCIAGIAIVGIIFGTKSFVEYHKIEIDKEED